VRIVVSVEFTGICASLVLGTPIGTVLTAAIWRGETAWKSA